MYSWGEIVRSLPKKKNSKSSLWVKWIIRKLSFPFTFLFINLGFSAWGASVLSIFVALAGCAALCVDSALWRVVGVVLVEFWLVMDCVDGNIARVKKTSSPMGGCIDAFSGYFITAFVFFSVGVAACYSTRFAEHAGLWVAMGGLSSAFGLLARLIHQKYTCCVLESKKIEKNGADGKNIEKSWGNMKVNSANRGNGETHETKEEANRANKETHRENGEANRTNGGENRENGEASRESWETYRTNGKANRGNTETYRTNGKANRGNTETHRANEEVNRESRETYRANEETNRESGETYRANEEVNRENGEMHRANEDANRGNGENNRKNGVQTANGKENEELLEKGGRLSYLRSRLDKEIGISGLFMPFLIVACIFRLYDVMTIFYFIFQGAGALAAAGYYALKTREKV